MLIPDGNIGKWLNGIFGDTGRASHLPQTQLHHFRPICSSSVGDRRLTDLLPCSSILPFQHLFIGHSRPMLGNKVCSSLMPEFAAWLEWWGEFEKLPYHCYWVPVNLSWAACTRPSLPLKGFPLTLNNYGSSITWNPIIMTRPGQHWTWFREDSVFSLSIQSHGTCFVFIVYTHFWSPLIDTTDLSLINSIIVCSCGLPFDHDHDMPVTPRNHSMSVCPHSLHCILMASNGYKLSLKQKTRKK